MICGYDDGNCLCRTCINNPIDNLRSACRDCKECRQAGHRKHNIGLCSDYTPNKATTGMTDQKKAGWIPVEPDKRGYTNQFECPHCGSFVHMGTYYKECDYDYCPYCGSYVEDGEQE